MRTILVAVLIGLVHMTLALFFASETPYRTEGRLMGSYSAPGVHAEIKDIGAPDERAHANFIQHVIDGKGLPVFKAGDPNLYESYQSHQAPAYYLVSAVWAKIVGVNDVSKPEAIRLRWLNAVIGATTIVGVFFLAFWGFGRKDVACGAAVFAALLPMLCALDGAITNDPMLYATVTWTLAFMAKGMTQGWNWRLALLVGLLMGLAFNTKTTSLSLVPVLFAACFLGQRMSVKFAAGALGLAIVLALPWWIRNSHLYGDPFALNVFVQGFHTPRPQDIIPGLPGGAFEYWTSWFGWWTTRSFFGAFGYMDIFLNSTGVPIPSARSGDTEILYRVMLLVFLLLALGWILSLGKADWKGAKAINVLNGVFLFVILATFLRFNLTYFQAQGRYVIPAIGPIACGVGVGLCVWSKDKWKLAVAALGVAMLGLNVYALNRLPEEFAKRITIVAPD